MAADSPFLSFVDELLNLFHSSPDVLHFGSWNQTKPHEDTKPDYIWKSVIFRATFRFNVILKLTQQAEEITHDHFPKALPLTEKMCLWRLLENI